MPKYRKKPIPVEAVQWFKVGDHPEVFQDITGAFQLEGGQGYIKTLEGIHVVSVGDYIVGPGVKGEYWPVKPDIFEVTYEKI